MRKISTQSTTFIDHRRKGKSLWLKKFKKKDIGNKISNKKVLELTGIKIWKLVSKNKKIHRQEERFCLIYWDRVTSLLSEMHLRLPVGTQQVWKLDLN